MQPADRVLLTEVRETVAAVDEKLDGFIRHCEYRLNESAERARKNSDRTAALEGDTDRRLEELSNGQRELREESLQRTTSLQTWVKAGTVLAAVIVPGFIVTIGYILSHIPPQAWSALGK
jgi:hypothetical protein